ncbi:parallel beta-helix domain-containing protein [Algiphilus sp. W345]|uniref:Parallel beta-helix domain-containing protein n=1 Tax=Banduia mediterranea TaxID=3075609 RepID=A0ABU2WDL6_9GAMM|nr:parallel beta-helix domain-containing protein [Algiphilus sp. W345]MDT0495965.1 parallel beta-helix domain-containing protein [Algiphilus sp. W345]
MNGTWTRVVLALGLAALGGCGSSPGPSGDGSGSGSGSGFKTFEVCGSDAQVRDQALIAFFDAREGDTIEFCEGRFSISTGLILHGKRGITIKGQGMDKTMLDFAESDSAEGLNISHSDGITLLGFTVRDTPGNAIRVFRSKYVTFRQIRALWSGYDTCDTDPDADDSCAHHGAYGLYPVESQHVLIEDSEAFGASDAGIYVGQTSDVIVRRTRAEYNVAGFEFENTYRAVFEDNIATNNTGGFLVFDLPNLAQYGTKNIIRNNQSYNNNTDNFAPIGNIVGIVPRGTGMLLLATDQLEVYGNEVNDNDTLGIAIVNYALADPNQPDQKYDFFPEGIHIHGNSFRDNGTNIQLPSADRGTSSLLPLLLKLKNLGRSAHITWDGAVDAPNGCTQIPLDADGIPLTEPNPNETRPEPRVDERGRPNFMGSDPEPECKWTEWKFAEGEDEPKLPENGLCIEDDNIFENTQPLGNLTTTDFLNAKLTSSATAQLVIDLLKPATTSLEPHRCQLPRRADPDLGLPFVPSADSDSARPSDSEVSKACNGGPSGEPNFAAAAQYNCPDLAQYGLFHDDEDPRSGANGGVLYGLSTPLFSDYANKHRFVFLPPGKAAKYQDHHDGITATLDFPVGTIIAKTFSFLDGADEHIIETRLLIKRETETGTTWIGLPYIWQDEGGKRVAKLTVEGGSAKVHYNFDDPDPDVDAHYEGQVERYGIPAAMNCISCHGGDDREPGSAPIGPKPRLMNRDMDYGDEGVMNQLVYWQMHGLLEGLPANLEDVERLPRWNVPGDTGELPDSEADIHLRVRAYLETNCAHCHNSHGGASNSGLYLDSFRTVDNRYGICKKPVAAGKGSGGRLYDIVPESANDSILPFRVGSAEAGVRMPPIARTVPHGEAVALIQQWIDTVLPTDDTEDADVCTGPLSGF